ncbi:MAG: RNA-binding cell elongation regulator Jag/EloR [Armatimonadota bacterium]
MAEVEVSGRTLEEAVELAARELGVTTDAVEYEIVEEGTKGFLGLGQTPTVVKARVKEGYVAAPKPAPAPVRELEVEEEESVPVEIISEEENIQPQAPATGTVGDPVVERAINILNDVLNAMGVDAKPVLKSADRDEVTIDLVGGDVAILIGKHGQTLDALQYLIGLAVAKHSTDRRRLILDAERYRARHQEMLERKAHEYADAVKAEGREAVLEPQDARDRRIIHMALAEDPDVYTYSEGEGSDRHVVISPKK